ncbi:hypothetical protein ACA910_020125 [Epithemia clementina (nom. ined.)]
MSSMDNFTTDQEAFVASVANQDGVVKTGILTDTTANTSMMFFVFSCLLAFDTLVDLGFFADSNFLTTCPPIKFEVGLDTDVGQEALLTQLIALNVWTLNNINGETVDQFCGLQDKSIQTLRKLSDMGFYGYQDNILDS